MLQEIGQARDTPDDIIFDHLQTVVYPDQPMGFPILGDEGDGRRASRATICKTYMGAQLSRRRDDAVASGAVNHAEIVRLAEEKFAALPRGTAAGAAGGALWRRRSAARPKITSRCM